MKNNKSDNEIIIYKGDCGQPTLEVRMENETIWLTQVQLVELYQSSKANVSEHIKNIFSEWELVREATVRNFRTVQKEGNRKVLRDIEHWGNYICKTRLASRH